jgi:hypothetical protein
MSMQQLMTKLPQVRGWILKTLEQHKLQARPVASYGFTRLPQFYSADTLASAVVVEVSKVPVPPLADMGLPEFAEFQNGNYAGITYLNTYFLSATEARDESLHFHELVHVIQWQHLGPDRFLAAYAAGYLLAKSQHKDPYRDNLLEVMAYDLQAHFDSNGQSGNVEPLIRQQCDQKVLPMLEQAIMGDAQS